MDVTLFSQLSIGPTIVMVVTLFSLTILSIVIERYNTQYRPNVE